MCSFVREENDARGQASRAPSCFRRNHQRANRRNAQALDFLVADTSIGLFYAAHGSPSATYDFRARLCRATPRNVGLPSRRCAKRSIQMRSNMGDRMRFYQAIVTPSISARRLRRRDWSSEVSGKGINRCRARPEEGRGGGLVNRDGAGGWVLMAPPNLDFQSRRGSRPRSSSGTPAELTFGQLVDDMRTLTTAAREKTARTSRAYCAAWPTRRCWSCDNGRARSF